ncbi:HTH domain-containing protein [Lachnospiraceae bacterium]|nr:HTH domain-containing protein [Lachnospiraceae bacterium]
MEPLILLDLGRFWGDLLDTTLQSAKVLETIATKNQNVTKETEILALLREDATMTTAGMAQKLSVNRRTVQRELEKLEKKNCIERKGGRRYGYWEIHE